MERPGSPSSGGLAQINLSEEVADSFQVEPTPKEVDVKERIGKNLSRDREKCT